MYGLPLIISSPKGNRATPDVLELVYVKTVSAKLANYSQIGKANNLGLEGAEFKTYFAVPLPQKSILFLKPLYPLLEFSYFSRGVAGILW